MIDPHKFLALLRASGVDFFTGVPDSLLKSFNACVMAEIPKERHVIAANEGNAIGLAMGHYLAGHGGPKSECLPLIYLQNSGLGNVINPLLSLADPEIYGIPMILLIGWRGQPGVRDEPQHVKQGRVMLAMLEAMEIPYALLGEEDESARGAFEEMRSVALEGSRPVALVAGKGAFAPYAGSFTPVSEGFHGHSEGFHAHSEREKALSLALKREDVIGKIAEIVGEKGVFVATTGMASRELFEYRAGRNALNGQDFLTVGGMGHANQIALGLALAAPKNKKRILCLDGDGALLMHLGGLAIIGAESPPNLIHILLNNGCHESVGGQPTTGFITDFCGMAKASGYASAISVETEAGLVSALEKALSGTETAFIEVRIAPGHREDLGRPTRTPKENKLEFMGHLATK